MIDPIEEVEELERQWDGVLKRLTLALEGADHYEISTARRKIAEWILIQVFSSQREYHYNAEMHAKIKLAVGMLDAVHDPQAVVGVRTRKKAEAALLTYYPHEDDLLWELFKNGEARG